MGSMDCFVGRFQGSPKGGISFAPQYNQWVERRRRGIFPSTAEVAVIASPSL